jgi:hypothetical protein
MAKRAAVFTISGGSNAVIKGFDLTQATSAAEVGQAFLDVSESLQSGDTGTMQYQIVDIDNL